MSLQSLLENEALRRREFPVCDNKIFLAHGGVSPLPRRVADAMQRYLEAAARDDQENIVPDQIIRETRQQAARLIDGHEDEIAFVGSTSMGLAIVAAGLSWQRGDNVVCYRDDYPANVYPWMDLAAQGVEVRFVEPRQYGNVTVADLDPIIDKKTRLVSLASAHFVSGWRLDVNEIGKFLKERGILFCLDGIQTFGALRESMRFVDFASADAHKWLLGPVGIGILYVRKEHFERLHPPLIGWRTAPCPDYVAQPTLSYWPSARRYEPGSLNLVGIVGLHAALQVILEVGPEIVEQQVLTLAQRVVARAADKKYEICGPQEQERLSGLVSITKEGWDPDKTQESLGGDSIVVSVRRKRDGTKYLRVSAHFYNSATEIDELMERL